MQEKPLNLISILQHAARWHGDQEVVTHTVEGEIHRQTYAETLTRASRLASGLADLGLGPGDRIGTLGWNTHRHLEAWYAIAGQGAICHTINPRLFPDQIRYIVNHAEDRILLVDLTFVDLLLELLPDLPSVESVVIMTDSGHMPDLDASPVPVHTYEDLVAGGDPQIEWPDVEEHSGAGLCYTSGTTGDPKGVLYTHRSNLFHAWAAAGPDVFGIGPMDSVLMVVPMFHANSWGLAYAAPMVGARLVMPGPHMGGESLHALMASERVNKAAAVPTVWNMLIDFLADSGAQLDFLDEVVIGGAAVPRSMIKTFKEHHDVDVIHGWGMTEMSPVGAINRPRSDLGMLKPDERLDLQAKQGRPMYGVDLEIVDDDDNPLPHDGKTFGRLLCRGPWVIERYYRAEASALTNGWFDTGDVATIDEHGYMQITDRAKDVIKSGGEWISSVDLENAAVAHPDVAMAACIGAIHPKWDERPVLLIKPVEGKSAPNTRMMGEFLSNSFARWQLPDLVVEVDDIPLTATGKIDKKPLRAKFSNVLIAA